MNLPFSEGENMVFHRWTAWRLGFRLGMGGAGFCPPGDTLLPGKFAMGLQRWLMALSCAPRNGALIQDLDNDRLPNNRMGNLVHAHR